jgi:hypothetical protein
VANALLLFDRVLSLVRTNHKALILKSLRRQYIYIYIYIYIAIYATKAVPVWQIMELSMMPKCQACEDHAYDQLELLKEGLLADFCEDWVEQLYQLGLKNDRRTKTIRNRGKKDKVYMQ